MGIGINITNLCELGFSKLNNLLYERLKQQERVEADLASNIKVKLIFVF